MRFTIKLQQNVKDVAPPTVKIARFDNDLNSYVESLILLIANICDLLPIGTE